MTSPFRTFALAGERAEGAMPYRPRVSRKARLSPAFQLMETLACLERQSKGTGSLPVAGTKQIKNKTIMDPILKNIVQQTGVDVRPLLPGRDDEYLLTYDDKLQVCFSFSNNKGKEYYDCCAWSCGAACYLTCHEGHVCLYSYLLKDVDVYDLAFVESKWSRMFDYLNDVVLKETKTIFTYISNFLIGHSEELLSTNNESYIKSLIALWRGDSNDFSDETNELFHTIWDGYFVDGRRLVPDKEIVKRYVLPSVFDLISILCLVGDTPSRIISRIPRGYNNGLIPAPAFRYLIQRNLKLVNRQETLNVFFPFALSISYVVEVVQELRRSGYNGIININLNHVLDIPDSYGICLLEYVNDPHISIRCRKNSWHFDDWPEEQNFIVAIPPFKLIGSLVESFRRDQIPVPDDWTSLENAIFAIFDNSRQSLVADGKLLVTCPNYVLDSDNSLAIRQRIASFMRLEKLVNLGANIDGLSPSSVTCIKASKKNDVVAANQQIIIQWCKNDGDGFFDAMRSQNKIKSGVPADNLDIVEYRIPENNYQCENWATRPYSENIIIDSLVGKINTRNLVPINSIFNVRLGVRTGLKQVFIISSEEYNALSDAEKPYFVKVANRHNMKSGQLLDECYLFYPYSKGLKVLTEFSLSRVLTTYGQKLKQYKEILKSRKLDSKKNWWDLTYRMLYHDLGTPRIISFDLFTKECNFAFDSSGSYVVANGYQWSPKKKSISNENIQYAYFALFCSDFFRKLVQIYCGTYKLSTSVFRFTKNSVDSIPIPDFSNNIFIDIIPELSEIGRAINRGGIESIDSKGLNNLIETIYYEIS